MVKIKILRPHSSKVQFRSWFPLDASYDGCLKMRQCKESRNTQRGRNHRGWAFVKDVLFNLSSLA